MIGIVICGHGRMGTGMLHAAELIVGPQQQVRSLEVHPGQGLDEVGAALRAAVAEVDRGAGAVLLTDLPGGTPCNVAAPLLATGNLSMVSGFNLPALVKLLTARAGAADPAQLAEIAADYGRRHTLTGRDLGQRTPRE